MGDAVGVGNITPVFVGRGKDVLVGVSRALFVGLANAGTAFVCVDSICMGTGVAVWAAVMMVMVESTTTDLSTPRSSIKARLTGAKRRGRSSPA